MVGYFGGVALFALGIMVTIALHEWGHMRSALACGMKVRRFYVGFGPTVVKWNRKGIEYGFKAVPLGGFCDIAGMTAMDEIDEDAPTPWCISRGGSAFLCCPVGC